MLAIGDDHRFNGRERVDIGELDRERYCRNARCASSRPTSSGLLRERGVRVEVDAAVGARGLDPGPGAGHNFGIAFMPESIARAASWLGHAGTTRPSSARSIALTPAERMANGAAGGDRLAAGAPLGRAGAEAA